MRRDGRRGRRAWLLPANAIVLAYALAAVVVLASDGLVADRRWLAVHLLLLGAVTNAIVVWGEHFAVTWLRAPQSPRRSAWARLAALNVAVIGVLVGVTAGSPPVTAVAAALLAVVVVGHLGVLLMTIRRAGQRRYSVTVWYYVAAGVALLAGAGLGVLLVAEPHSWPDGEAVHAAHVHANLLGWVGLTVLGTLFTLWPTVLRTRIADDAVRAASWCLGLTAAGLMVLVPALALHQRGPAVVGLLAYAAGVAVALGPFLSTWRRKPTGDAASWSMALAVGWLLVAVLVDSVLLATSVDAEQYAGRLDRLVPPLVVGFAGQIVLGALTYLLPVALGGGPAALRAASATLGRGWRVRVVLLNLAVPLLAVGTPSWVRVAGWVLGAVATVAFLLLAVLAVARTRPAIGTTRPAAPPAGPHPSR